MVSAKREFTELVQGTYFTVYFRKANGQIRRLNGRLGVRKYMKGTGKDQTHPMVVTAWDQKIGAYRSFRLDRVLSIKARGVFVVSSKG